MKCGITMALQEVSSIFLRKFMKLYRLELSPTKYLKNQAHRKNLCVRFLYIKPIVLKNKRLAFFI